MSNNSIQFLPDELGLLSKLMSFQIRNNKLSLEQTILNGNLHVADKPCLLLIFSYICEGSAREIRQFLYARLKKSLPQNRVKLILVGDPNAGKTTLLKSLMKSRRGRTLSGSAFDVFSSSSSKFTPTLATVGVNVVEITLKQGSR